MFFFILYLYVQCGGWRTYSTGHILNLDRYVFMLVVAHEEFNSRPFRCKDINKNKTINYHSKKQKQTSVMLNDTGWSILSKTAYRVIL